MLDNRLLVGRSFINAGSPILVNNNLSCRVHESTLLINRIDMETDNAVNVTNLGQRCDVSPATAT